MTSGAPIYLVSACASGEQFVAAFRRYADKNGLFVPIAVPLPAGRRGRFAVTLRDGGVMIEGEADIVSSATTPSVLHGRVGMTLRFLDPDIKSKTVLIELEQARLAMKPQPPSVPPRPARIPAEPRPKVPTLAGRIDANNALAECVAIGDVDALEATVPQAPKSGPRFVVPTIPPVSGQRPKSPSTPFAFPAKPPRPQTPSTTPAIPPKPSASPPFVPAPTTPGGVTLVDAPIVPAPATGRTSTMQGIRPLDRSSGAPRSPSGVKPSEAPRAAPKDTPMSITTIDAPIVTPTPTSMAAVSPPSSAPKVTPMSVTTIDAPIITPSVTSGWDAQEPPATETAPETRDTVAMPAIARTMSDDLTYVPQVRDAGMFQVQVPPGSDSDTFPAVIVSEPDGVPEPVPETPSKSNGSARMGLPPPRRTSGNTQPPARNPTPAQPMPVIKGRPPTPSQPLPAVKTGNTGPIGIAMPRGNPTRIGLPIVELKTPAQPSGAVPLPPVVAEAKPEVTPPELSDEPTDITGVPVIADELADSAALIMEAPVVEEPPPRARRPSVPGGQRKTVMGVAVVPDGVTVVPATPSTPVATPAEDAEPKVEVSLDATLEEMPAKPVVRPPVIEEPSGDWTMIPGATGPTILPRKLEPKVEDPPDSSKLPTGDWTIARVEDSPDGWSEPSKVAPVRPGNRGNTGPPVAMVAGEKPLEVTMTAKAFEFEQETRSGLKVEVDSSLGVERSTASADVSLASTQFAAPMSQYTPPPGSIAPVPMSQGSGQFPDFQTAKRSSGPADLFSDAAATESTAVSERNRKRRILIIALAAGAALALGAVLLVVFGLGGEPRQDTPRGGSDTGVKAVAPVAPDATAAIAVDPVVVDAGVAEVAPDAAVITKACTVDVSSTPSGAEISVGKEVLGTTPAKLTLPCGEQARIVLRRGKLVSSRVVKPTTVGGKLRVVFAKPMFSVKVTSSPPGATITTGGKSLGVTPAMVKLAAQEPATLVISKPGFTQDTQKITPKQNNQSVHVTLKKKPR